MDVIRRNIEDEVQVRFQGSYHRLILGHRRQTEESVRVHTHAGNPDLIRMDFRVGMLQQPFDGQSKSRLSIGVHNEDAFLASEWRVVFDVSIFRKFIGARALLSSLLPALKGPSFHLEMLL